MDRDEAFRLLRGGLIAEWNRRRGTSDMLPYLGGAKLEGADLRKADLRGADLYGAYLDRADLDGANLDRANLRGARLRGAKLHGANLTGANLAEAYLAGANFQGAIFLYTEFINVDLSEVNGLDSVRHTGPSHISTNTLIRSNGKIPEKFLRGCGLPEALITYLPSILGSMSPIQFYSCFISFSSKNQPFVERLYNDLQGKGVRCWFAPEDLKIGEKMRVGIDEAIRLHDKLLLVLSKHSVESVWVEKEVETAMEQERRQSRIILFPIRLDDAVTKADVGWAADIRRSRHIGDFRKWKDHDAYQKAFGRLIRDLEA